MKRAAVLASVALLVALGLGGTCDNQDISGQFFLGLDGSSARVVQAYEQPYVGRVSIDYGLTNTGATDATYELAVQAQTSGATDAPACEQSTKLPRERSLAAVDAELALVDGAQPELLRARDRLQRFTVPTGGRGAFAVRVLNESAYRIYLGDADAELIVLQGEDRVDPVGAGVDLSSCPQTLAQFAEFVLVEGTFLVVADTDQATLDVYIEEACTATRTVPRTCPGTASDVYSTGPLEVPAGGFLSGRIDSLGLGIGDLSVVEFACGSADCEGDVELFYVIEQLECRSSSDCRGSGSCSELGYCLSSSSGCSAGGARRAGQSTIPALLLLVALVLCRGRRLHRMVLTASLSLLAFAPSLEAAEPRRHVYVQPTIVSHQFTGQVGRFASAGVGLHATQGVQLGWLGAHVSIGADYYLTNQPPPPYTRGLQTVLIAAGARVAFPVEVVRPIMWVEYASLGVSSNALNRFTGNALHYHGVGAGLAARFESAMPLYLEGQFTGRLFPGMREPTVQWGIGLAIGVAGFF